jgi:hypothetical protein
MSQEPVSWVYAYLTEPLFVPEYWNPPSLWNLARTFGLYWSSMYEHLAWRRNR